MARVATLGHFDIGIGTHFGIKVGLLITVACLLAPPLYYLYRYRSSIKRRVDEIENRIVVRVVRNKDASTKKRRVVCMELDPTFVEANPEWKMMSLGGYLPQ